jgi:hypothetical protein
MTRRTQHSDSQSPTPVSRSSWLVLLCTVGLVAATTLTACGGGSGDDNGDSPPDDVGTDGGQTDIGTPDGTSSPDGGTPDAGPPENFEVNGFGVLPPRAASCESPGQTQRLRFFFQNNQFHPLTPGDYVGGVEIAPNQVVNAGALDSERTRVATGQRCSSPSDCPGNLKCGSSGLPTAQKYCLAQTGVSFEPGTVQFDYNPGRTDSDKQLIGILWENTGSWTGFLPNPVATQYDSNGDQDFRRNEARATDPGYLFEETYTTFGTYIPTTTSPSNTKVGGWTYAGETGTKTAAFENDGPQDEDYFTNTLSAPENWLDEKNDLNGISPANTYQSMIAAMDDFGLDKYSDHEKFLVVVTDGPNEVKDQDATFQDVLDKANNMGIHLMIMHLDARVDASLMRDLPSYYAGDAACRQNDCGYPSPCSSDSECLNFETCRKATIYADSEEASVSQTEQRYCMPDYENGRLGPINQYAQLACQTEGQYHYLTNPRQFSRYARLLPYSFDGQWSIETNMSALSEENGLDGNFHNLSGIVSGLLGTGGISRLTARGFNFVSPPVDTRLLLQTGNPSGGSNN